MEETNLIDRDRTAAETSVESAAWASGYGAIRHTPGSGTTSGGEFEAPARRRRVG